MARSRGRTWGQDELDVFRLFGVVPPEPAGQVQRVLGSGFVISAAGEILTNNHVIEGAAPTRSPRLGTTGNATTPSWSAEIH